MSIEVKEIEGPGERTNKDRTNLLEVQNDIRAIAGHLFRCWPEDITIELSTGEINGDPYIFSELLHKEKPLEKSRHFPVGPYSGFGETIEMAIIDLLFIVRIRAEETAMRLVEILKEREYPTGADLNAIWSVKQQDPPG